MQAEPGNSLRRIGTMSEPDWKRQSRIKENAWRWSARRLELEVVTDELEGDLTDEEKEMLDHVRKVVCKTLLRWGERIERRRKGKL
jgi:hypothetical protein